MSCSQCKISLAGLGYVEKDKKTLCTKCYNLKYGKTCTECRKSIPTGNKVSYSVTQGM